MKRPASLSSDPYRHRIGTLYFLQRNPQAVDTFAENEAEGSGEDGQTPLDYGTGLPGTKTGIGARAF